ncbi:hypothetical protein EVAR_26982_1 [Eumeta japonica]|uniref:Uncharacterized protein n=1 Tax=Eumeta variegata TaxID=151549 RepID=A0A4C1VJN3_EUMVA|nr:hypothetical protein EVAR_26982_1 [Eumeta japonica]
MNSVNGEFTPSLSTMYETWKAEHRRPPWCRPAGGNPFNKRQLTQHYKVTARQVPRMPTPALLLKHARVECYMEFSELFGENPVRDITKIILEMRLGFIVITLRGSAEGNRVSSTPQAMQVLPAMTTF